MSQLSSRLEYQDLGFEDYKAEILNTQFANFAGLGLAAQTAELAPYSKEDITQQNTVTATPVKFTKLVNISEEQLRWNLWPDINNLVGAAANSINQRIDTNVAKMYYLGGGTTFFTGSDSVSLFNSAHTMGDGTSQSNTGTSPLNYANLKTTAQNLDRLYDDTASGGVQMLPCKKLRLIVARENLENAKEVLRSFGDPSSANRVKNVFSDGDYIDLKVANYIPLSGGYTKYWFLIDLERASLQNTKIVWGWKPKFDSDKIINNGSLAYTASVDFIPTTSSFQWAYGQLATS